MASRELPVWRRPVCCSASRHRLQLPVIIDRERGMIREAFVLVNGGGDGFVGNAGRSDLIIDTPAYVLCPGLATITPPRVLVRLFVDFAKNVHEAAAIKHI